MKMTKRFAAMAAALVIAGSMMSVTAFAASVSDSAPTTYTISVSNTTESTYEVYQLLTGTFETVAGEKVLVGATVGTGVKEDTTVEQVQTAVENATKDVNLSKILGTTKEGTLYKENTSLTGLAQGYYAIVETQGTGNEAKTAKILKIVDANLTITSKLGTTTFEKKLKDTDDTAGTTTDWQDGADWDVGDYVPFKLEATLPENVSAYDGYYLQFTDEINKAFNVKTAADLVGFTVKIGTKTISANTTAGENKGYDLVVTDNKFTLTIPDAKKLGATDNSVVTVEYTAKLGKAVAQTEDTNVTYGKGGNENTAKVTYSNNPEFVMYPDNDNDGNPDNPDKPETPGNDYKEDSPDDTVRVFTYKTVISKVDENKDALTGADFTLYKKKGNDYEVVATKVGTTAGSTFTFYGLDDGEYKLEETTVPTGYNGIEPIEFTISATHSENNVDEPVLTELKAVNLEEKAATATVAANTTTGSIETGTIEANIENKKGISLPETGGMGTKVFYAVGGSIVLASGVLLITKKRAKKD